MAKSAERMEQSSDWGRNTLEGLGEKVMVANSPLMSWGYSVMSVRSFAGLIGTIEIILGVLIATRPIAPKVSAIGSIGAIIMFLLTLTFVFTTPGVCSPVTASRSRRRCRDSFWQRTLCLLGAAIWTAGEALRAARRM